MKKASVVERNGKYYVLCYDRGWVEMCRLNKQKEWETCLFDTFEEAQAEADRYNECWN